MDNIEDIAAVPGVNTLMLGIGDLKATLGIPIRNPDGLFDETKFRKAMAKMTAVSRKTGMPLMMPAFRLKPGDVEFLQDFKMIITSLDVLSVFERHRLDIACMKEALGMEEKASNGQLQSQDISVQKGDEDGVQNGHVNGIQNGRDNGILNGYQNGGDQNGYKNGVQNGHDNGDQKVHEGGVQNGH